MTVVTNPTKIDVNRLAFALACIVAIVLVAIGKLPMSALTTLLPWLLPSPLKSTMPDDHSTGVDGSP